MINEHRKNLAIVQAKLAALNALSDAFDTALREPAFERHTRENLRGGPQKAVRDMIDPLKTYEATLLKSITHLEQKK